MDLLQREIFVDEADLRKFGFDDFQNRIKLLTVRTLEVAEFDDGELGVSGAGGRRIAELDFGAIGGEGVLGHVADFAAEHVVTVFGDVDRAGFVMALIVDGDGNLEQVGDFGGSDEAKFDFVFGPPAEKDAEIGFDFG